MINIRDKHKCCGCKACVQRCPKSCISLVTDECGFYYPKVNLNKCIDCGLCEAVCPVINKGVARLPIDQYWGVNKDEEIRMTSSSGGIFYAIATEIIRQGGYVAGAVFNEKWLAQHVVTDSIKGLTAFKGSKYIQSDICQVYLETEKLLKSGKKVLFSGTPCQVAGLKGFLRKPYENLLCVDIVCHGVPSPMVWKDYVTEITGKTSYWKYIDSITFKDKSKSWGQYALDIRFHDDKGKGEVLNQSTKENMYTVCFLRNYTLRPSCFECPAKAGRSGSDITLGDFWGINSFYPELNDEKGSSVVMCYTEKGIELLKRQNIAVKGISYHEATVYNPATTQSPQETSKIIKFWKEYLSAEDKIDVLEKYSDPITPSIYQRLKNIVKRILNKLRK